ncbi:MAG: hypothetical protein LBS96_05815, partial [Oscillospiraceae bacterium]|nr:hypothetical protein [Oscillospiraceae bacterium]
RVLEINSNHPICQKLTALAEQPETLKQYALLLYNQALLIEGFPVEDAVEFSNAICNLMVS